MGGLVRVGSIMTCVGSKARYQKKKAKTQVMDSGLFPIRYFWGWGVVCSGVVVVGVSIC